MNILAIETSSSLLSVALGRSDGVSAEINLDGGLHHAENLISLVQVALEALKLKKREIDLVACGMGPGSFTGLRIGLAAAKGLGLGLQKKIAGFSSLDIASEGIPLETGKLAVILDARREALYAAMYRFDKGVRKKIVKESLFSIDQFIERIDGKTMLMGNALETYGEKIRRIYPKVSFVEKRFWNPKASSLLSLIQKQKGKIKFLKPEQLKPAYLRLSEAEERRKKH